MKITEKITEILKANIQLEINYKFACVDVVNFEIAAGKVMEFITEVTGIKDEELTSEEFYNQEGETK